MIGARGGVGASTVATNLATSIQQAQQAGAGRIGGSRSCMAAILDCSWIFIRSRTETSLEGYFTTGRDDRTEQLGSTHSSGLHLLASGYEGFDELSPCTGQYDAGDRSSPIHAPACLCRLRTCAGTGGQGSAGLLRSDHRCHDTLVAGDSANQAVCLRRCGCRHYPVGEGGCGRQPVCQRAKRAVERDGRSVGYARWRDLIPNDYGTASEAIDHGKPLTIMASTTTIGQWYLRGTESLSLPIRGCQQRGRGRKARVRKPPSSDDVCSVLGLERETKAVRSLIS